MADRTPSRAWKAFVVLVLGTSLAAMAFASPFCVCGQPAPERAAGATGPPCHGSGDAPAPSDHEDHGVGHGACKMACHMPAVLGGAERLAARIPRVEAVAEPALLPAPPVAFEIDHVPLA